MTMANAPEGRTYMKKQWVLDPDIVSGRRPSRHHHRYYDADEYVIEKTPFVVPNGKWVMEETLVAGRSSWLVGIDHSELKQATLSSLYGAHEVLYISDKPFGYVCADEEDVDPLSLQVKPGRRKTLVYARQVHKGELGRGVRIPWLDYVREPLAPHRGHNMKARDRRRGQYGWVKLVDLGEMTVGYRPSDLVELILGYWQFSGHRNYQDDGQLVDVAWGSHHDIKDGTAEFRSLTCKQFRDECDDLSEMWVRCGFARTILRLQALAVQPEATQPV